MMLNVPKKVQEEVKNYTEEEKKAIEKKEHKLHEERMAWVIEQGEKARERRGEK
ncbi:MAG: hypothetical protein SVO01_07680 [Thermotogota bacterium]|nr:hypothetical protein [Thermotogota bacterium]